MFTRRFLIDAAERALKTFAQTLVSVATVTTVADVQAGWKGWVATAGLAAGMSVLTSIASSAQKDSISPASLAPPN